MIRPILQRGLLSGMLMAVVLPATSSAQGFVAQVSEPRNVQAYGYVAQWLQSSRFLDEVASGMNQAFVLPERAWIIGAECGQENAFWRPDRRSIVICYELLNGIFREFQYDGLSQEQFGAAVASASSFILFHEIGHALIDILDLPVTGREEDVVDQFATLLLAAGDGTAAYWAAQYWRQRNDVGDLGIFKFDSTPFSDEHGFDDQRFYNILCWTYGQNPAQRAYVLQLLPQARAVRCPSEYQQMARAWEGLLTAHGRPGFGTGGGSVAQQPSSNGVIRRRDQWETPGKPTSRLSGRWRYEETIGNASTPLFCVNNGTYDLQASGQALTGQYQQVGSCVVSGERFDNPGSGTLTSGRAQGDQIYFVVDNCTYQGRIDPRSANRMVGELACAVEGDRGTQQVVGSWRADRF